MEKQQSQGGIGGYPPPSGRFPAGSLSVKAEPLSAASPSSSSFLPMAPNTTDPYGFSHDISRMSDNPPKGMGHRRAHSEILTLPDDISFDSDLGVVGGGIDGPSLSDEAEEDLLSVYLDMDKFNSPSSSASSSFQIGESSYLKNSQPSKEFPNLRSSEDGGDKASRIRHQHSLSMDGSTSIKPEMLIAGTEEASAADSKKAMSAAKLAELALIDPKRAKRIWANRQSAARSKERKMRYIAELERKVQTLQTEATSLSAQLTLLQVNNHLNSSDIHISKRLLLKRDTNGLTAENSELKLRLQTVEQQVRLQDALNEALKEEIHHLKVLTGQPIPNGGQMMNFSPYGGAQPFYPGNQSMHTLLAAQQFQQLQIHPQKQQPFHQPQETKVRASPDVVSQTAKD